MRLTRILGAKDPKAFVITRQSFDLQKNVVIINGLEIKNGDIDDFATFEVFVYDRDAEVISTVSAHGWHDEVAEFARENANKELLKFLKYD